MNAKEMLGVLLACVLNLSMVVMVVNDGQSFSWIFPMMAATAGAIVGNSGVSEFRYRNTSWKQAWRYRRKGLYPGILVGTISTILILAHESLLYPEVFAGTNGSLYAVSVGIFYVVPSGIGGFVGGEIQSNIHRYIEQTV